MPYAYIVLMPLCCLLGYAANRWCLDTLPLSCIDGCGYPHKGAAQYLIPGEGFWAWHVILP